jgi:hypothetical protein
MLVACRLAGLSALEAYYTEACPEPPERLGGAGNGRQGRTIRQDASPGFGFDREDADARASKWTASPRVLKGTFNPDRPATAAMFGRTYS